MNPLSLSIASIRTRKMQSFLCFAAAAAGVALLCAIFLLSQSVNRGFARNAEGIDIVVGAKGSPLQLVLSTIYHADVPTGNIHADDADKIAHNPQVKEAIPLALGDNYHGFRIAGTTPEYISLLGGSLAEGKVFDAPFEAVAGAATGLNTGDSFAGAHGLSAESTDIHKDHLYKITGRLAPTGTVLDRLIVTSVKSVQELHHHHHHHDDGDEGEEEAEGHHHEDGDDEHAHEDHDHEDHDHDEAAEHHHDDGDDDHAHEDHDHDHDEGEAPEHQITALLLKTRSPMAVMSLPRQINAQSGLQAASPAYEVARLASMMGMGRDVLGVLGLGFIALSGLMLLSALASGLAARRYDLGVLRVLGASPAALFATVMCEGAALSLAGTAAGIVLGHLAAYTVAVQVESLRGIVLPATLLQLSSLDALLLALGAGVGITAGVVPALSAARTDIAALLARGRG
jgi:putative ABC transport system permease protein